MQQAHKPYRLILSGGGTGGHIYPAIAVADTFKRRYPDAEILFVGAEGRMEMEKVPKAGYEVVGLPIAGIQRRLTWENLKFPFKLWKSLRKAGSLIKSFQPDLAAGFGGYASGPLLRKAAQRGIPTLLQEQNSYAGLTNKWLAKKAAVICVAYEGMEKYFEKGKIKITGNPVRQDIAVASSSQQENKTFFGLDPDKSCLLVIGGSLGARTINRSMLQHIQAIVASGCQVIWQTGKLYFDEMNQKTNEYQLTGVVVKDFIYDMDKAYGAADLVVSRAGALSVSELSLTGLPTILVPSPNVAEDHQTKNAQALERNQAAVLVPDQDAQEKIGDVIIGLMNDPDKRKSMSEHILQMAKPNAAEAIVDEIEKLLP